MSKITLDQVNEQVKKSENKIRKAIADELHDIFKVCMRRAKVETMVTESDEGTDIKVKIYVDLF